MTLFAAKKTLFGRSAKGRRLIFFLGLAVTILFTALYIFPPAFLGFLDKKLYDHLLRSYQPGEIASNQIIIDIDEKSLKLFGQWPWPRWRVALLLGKIKALGAVSVGMDMVFPEADRTSLDVLQKEIARDLKMNVDFSRLPETVRDNDLILASTLAGGPYVLGYSFLFSEREERPGACLLHPLNITVIKGPGVRDETGAFYKATGGVCNLEALAGAARSTGFFNTILDDDGVLRKTPLLIVYEGKFYPSLALATLIEASGIKQITVWLNAGGVEKIALDKTIIPVDARGNMLVHYRGGAFAFPYVSAADILLDLVPKEKVEGKIAFLGTTAVGVGEFRATPPDPIFPGVEVHATVTDNIIKKDFLHRPNWAQGLEVALVAVSGLISTLLLALTGAFWGFFVLALFGYGLWEFSLMLFQSRGLVISALMPLIAAAANFSLLTAVKYFQEERKLKGKIEELLCTQEFTIQCLAYLTETRDSNTGGHILRCQHYVKSLARQMASMDKFRPALDEDTIDLLYKSAPLHDIGKVGISDNILRKQGRLDDAEFAEMKRHPALGLRAILTAEQNYGKLVDNRFLQYGKEMSYAHHEKWDGTGYPEGLKGEEISLLGRIMAIADVYDALISRRPYKKPMTHAEAVAFIAGARGSHFDPDIVDAFLKIHEEFDAIARRLPDFETASV